MCAAISHSHLSNLDSPRKVCIALKTRRNTSWVRSRLSSTEKPLRTKKDWTLGRNLRKSFSEFSSTRIPAWICAISSRMGSRSTGSDLKEGGTLAERFPPTDVSIGSGIHRPRQAAKHWSQIRRHGLRKYFLYQDMLPGPPCQFLGGLTADPTDKVARPWAGHCC